MQSKPELVDLKIDIIAVGDLKRPSLSPVSCLSAFDYVPKDAENDQKETQNDQKETKNDQKETHNDHKKKENDLKETKNDHKEMQNYHI